MAKQIQPTSLIMIIAVIVFIAAKWAYDKGTSSSSGMHVTM